MATKADELKVYSFTDSDIDLITFALRRFKNCAVFQSSKDDVKNLLQYIERLKKENQ